MIGQLSDANERLTGRAVRARDGRDPQGLVAGPARCHRGHRRQGDRVWAVWSLTATHSGPPYGSPATGNKIDITEVAIWRFEDGLVAEHWYFADEFAMLRQLGVPQSRSAWPSRTRCR
jgi:SnoaL-like polyketide cyclase